MDTAKIKGAIAIIAAVIMYFTPDNVDRVIEALLTAFGVSEFILTKKNDNGIIA